ncbi:hypothetical protein CL621_00215 [archaeon]|nr:hypothetical protein [archaeon]
MYQPREDSFLLQKYVKKYAKGSVLDLGSGSGIQALTALKKTKEVLAADIDKEAVKLLKAKGLNSRFSNLFSNIKEKFDLIIFNPPYLPNSKFKDIALDGGKKGYEVLERFFSQVKNYLKKDGKILIVFSSLTKPKKVKEIIKKNNFNFKLLEEKKLPFEKLYVVLVEKFL